MSKNVVTAKPRNFDEDTSTIVRNQPKHSLHLRGRTRKRLDGHLSLSRKSGHRDAKRMALTGKLVHMRGERFSMPMTTSSGFAYVARAFFLHHLPQWASGTSFGKVALQPRTAIGIQMCLPGSRRPRAKFQ